MIINEAKVINILENSKKVFLLEPNYRKQYVPLGLAKIASFVKKHGGTVQYGRNYKGENCDLICVTSLFTYYSKQVLDSLLEIKYYNKKVPVIIGGIFASMMPKIIDGIFKNIMIFKGYSRELDLYSPDYSIDWGEHKKFKDFSNVFTTRGCPNKCPYCIVWRIEDCWINPNWKQHILDSGKPKVMISDNNNLTPEFHEHYLELFDFLVKEDKRLIFNNGFDCKCIDSKEVAKNLARLKYESYGLRLAFDRIEEDGIFQNSIKLLLNEGISKWKMMAFVLFNFKDTPQEANYRFTECVKLGVRPYPQKYVQLDCLNLNNAFVSKYWTKNLANVFRTFWLMMGYYRKMTFDEYIESDLFKGKLSDEDIEKWKK